MHNNCQGDVSNFEGCDAQRWMATAYYWHARALPPTRLGDAEPPSIGFPTLSSDDARYRPMI